jgi:hypothetical protein
MLYDCLVVNLLIAICDRVPGKPLPPRLSASGGQAGASGRIGEQTLNLVREFTSIGVEEPVRVGRAGYDDSAACPGRDLIGISGWNRDEWSSRSRGLEEDERRTLDLGAEQEQVCGTISFQNFVPRRI